MLGVGLHLVGKIVLTGEWEVLEEGEAAVAAWWLNFRGAGDKGLPKVLGMNLMRWVL